MPTVTTSSADALDAVRAALGPEPSAAGHPAVIAADELAGQLQADAERVDVEGVTRSRVDLLAARGLLAVTAPAAGGGRILFVHLPARDQPGMRAGVAMETAAMQAARTTSLQLEGLVVRADDVVDVVAAWPRRLRRSAVVPTA